MTRIGSRMGLWWMTDSGVEKLPFNLLPQGSAYWFIPTRLLVPDAHHPRHPPPRDPKRGGGETPAVKASSLPPPPMALGKTPRKNESPHG